MKWPALNNEKEHEAIPYELCSAKTDSCGQPGLPVFYHCLYSGAVANGLSHFFTKQVKKILPDQFAFLVSLHDIGKVSPGFQGKYFMKLLETHSPFWARQFRNGGCETNHAEIGAASYMEIACAEQDDSVVQAIACHHGIPKQFIRPNTDGINWQKERERLVNALSEAFNTCLNPSLAQIKNGRLLAGLVCVADWIASNEEYFPQSNQPIPQKELSEHVAKILSDAGFSQKKFVSGLEFGDLFQDEHRNSFSPRQEQKSLISVVDQPGIYIMEASMGSGKTEAALYTAYSMIDKGYNAGIYFALPTRLTSDRIYQRMQNFLDKAMDEKIPVRLSHGRAWLDNYQIRGAGTECHELPSWFSPAKRGLLYPFAVGTIDQALLASMNVRHSFVRLFGLAGKVVILDEVHSYDMYTGSLVEALVQDLRNVGCTVIILSATLTQEKRNALLGCFTQNDAKYPLVSGNVNGKLVLDAPRSDAPEKRIDLKYLEGGKNIVADALEKARAGCNVLCVANTVKQAQSWYLSLKEAMSEADIEQINLGLLHSRFPDFRRAEIEDKWMMLLGKGEEHRPERSILISTQIVEQSVDIDADYLISETAPIDMLFQRMGRLWRHSRSRRPISSPVCAIAFNDISPANAEYSEEEFFNWVGKGSCHVYAPYVLLRTLQVLNGRDSVSIPDDLRKLIESVYEQRTEDTASLTENHFKEEMEAKKKEMQMAASAAEASVVSMPAMDDSEEMPPTRYGSRKMVSLLLLRSCNNGIVNGQTSIELLNGANVIVDDLRCNFGVTKALYSNLASVPVTKKLADHIRNKDCKILNNYFHAGEMPLLCRVEMNGKLVFESTDSETGLFYRDDLGIYNPELMSESGNAENTISDASTPFDLGGADW